MKIITDIDAAAGRNEMTWTTRKDIAGRTVHQPTTADSRGRRFWITKTAAGWKINTRGEGYNDIAKPIPADRKCTVCGANDFQRRSDDSADSLKQRLMEYYKKTSPLLGYYHAKGVLKSVDGLAEIDDVAASIATALA